MNSGGGVAARVAIVAEGTYHAGVAGDVHTVARIAAGCLLLLLLCHGCERLCGGCLHRNIAARFRLWRMRH